GRAVGLDDVFLRVHVAARDAPVVVQLVIHAQQVFTARRVVRRLADEVDARASGEVRRREHVERCDTGRVEPARRNAPENAAILEAAAGVGRAARQAGGVVPDVRERVAGAVDALREVSVPLELRRDARLALAAGLFATLVLLAEEEEQLLLALVEAGRPDRAAEGVARVVVLARRDRRVGAVVGPAVGVPVGAPAVPVARAVEVARA